MPQKSKYSPEEKIRIVEAYLNQEISTAAQAAVPQRRRAILGILGRQTGLCLLSAAGKVPEQDGQGRGAEGAGQLFQALRSAAFLQAMGAGVPGGAEEAADLVRGHLCRPEMGAELNTRLATKF